MKKVRSQYIFLPNIINTGPTHNKGYIHIAAGALIQNRILEIVNSYRDYLPLDLFVSNMINVIENEIINVEFSSGLCHSTIHIHQTLSEILNKK